MPTMFPNFDFADFGGKTAFFRAKQDAARARGVFHLLRKVDEYVDHEETSARELSSGLRTMFGFHPQMCRHLTSLLVGDDPAGHAFTRGQRGILTRHDSFASMLAAIAN